MTYVLILLIASGSADTPTAVRHVGVSGGERACVTRLAVELDRAHRRGERVIEAECRRA
jgi:hypothetical protein